jgi:hypothetical protein
MFSFRRTQEIVLRKPWDPSHLLVTVFIFINFAPPPDFTFLPIPRSLLPPLIRSFPHLAISIGLHCANPFSFSTIPPAPPYPTPFLPVLILHSVSKFGTPARAGTNPAQCGCEARANVATPAEPAEGDVLSITGGPGPESRCEGDPAGTAFDRGFTVLDLHLTDF